MAGWPAGNGAGRQALCHAHLRPSEACVVPAVAPRWEGPRALSPTTKFLRAASVTVVAHLRGERGGGVKIIVPKYKHM